MGHHGAYLQVLGSTNIALNWLSLPPVCTWQSMQTVVRQPAEAGGVVRGEGHGSSARIVAQAPSGAQGEQQVCCAQPGIMAALPCCLQPADSPKGTR